MHTPEEEGGEGQFGDSHTRPTRNSVGRHCARWHLRSKETLPADDHSEHPHGGRFRQSGQLIQPVIAVWPVMMRRHAMHSGKCIAPSASRSLPRSSKRRANVPTPLLSLPVPLNLMYGNPFICRTGYTKVCPVLSAASTPIVAYACLDGNRISALKLQFTRRNKSIHVRGLKSVL